jgi:hypothetical protein
MTGKQIYPKSRIPNEVQQLVLQLHREGETQFDIARITGLHLKQVEAIIEGGIVRLRVTKPKRCGCGALLVAVPCLSCQLVGVAS